MHKVMGLLMSSKDGGGSVRVVQAAHSFGEAVEREVSGSVLCLRATSTVLISFMT